MKLVTIKQIGKRKYIFQHSGESLFDVLMDSQNLSFPDVEKCGICQSDDIFFEAHYGTDENGKEAYEYVCIRCKKCGATLTLGRNKNSDIFHLRKDKKKNIAWVKYEKTTEQGACNGANKQKPVYKIRRA